MLKCKNKSFAEVKKRDIMNFQNFLISEQNLSPNRVKHLKSSLSSLSNFIEAILDEEEEWRNFRNIIGKIPSPQKQEIREKTVLTKEQVDKLLNYFVDKKDYQRACFISVLAYGGARKAEIIQFQSSWFSDENVKFGMYKTPKIRTKGKGKIGKQLNKYVIQSLTKPYLDLWMEQRKELGIEIDDLFVIKRNNVWQPVKISTVDSWAEKFSEILQIPVYLHSFRHYFVTSLKQFNIPLSKIRDIVGHESSSTTEIYDDTEKESGFEGLFSDEGIIMQDKTSSIDDIK